MSYLEVVSRLAESLGVPDPWRIRLSIKISSYSDKVIVPHENLTLDRILDYGEEHATVPFEEIFYEVMDVSVLELQTKRILKVGWLNSKVQEEGTHQVLVSKDGTVLDIWNAFREKLGRTVDDQRVRFLQHLHHRIVPLEFSTPVSSLDGAFYFEEVQPEDLQKGAMDAWVEVVHFQKDPQRRFGIPFYILVREVSWPVSVFLRDLIALSLEGDVWVGSQPYSGTSGCSRQGIREIQTWYRDFDVH